MKQIPVLALILSALNLSAQSKISRPRTLPSIKPVIEQVARDYYQNFDHIKGDTVNQTVSTIEFRSKIAPAGALETSITKYVAPYSYTWQTTLLQTEDYESAVARYKEYYRQLNHCTLTFYDKTSYKLSGYFDTPDESRPFASSILALDGTNPDLDLFKVEVALNYSMPEWTVRVMVYEKPADKDIRPTAN